jgi:hypothetical protein
MLFEAPKKKNLNKISVSHRHVQADQTYELFFEKKKAQFRPYCFEGRLVCLQQCWAVRHLLYLYAGNSHSQAV